MVVPSLVVCLVPPPGGGGWVPPLGPPGEGGGSFSRNLQGMIFHFFTDPRTPPGEGGRGVSFLHGTFTFCMYTNFDTFWHFACHFYPLASKGKNMGPPMPFYDTLFLLKCVTFWHPKLTYYYFFVIFFTFFDIFMVPSFL